MGAAAMDEGAGRMLAGRTDRSGVYAAYAPGVFKAIGQELKGERGELSVAPGVAVVVSRLELRCARRSRETLALACLAHTASAA
jgi:hypothetical protein